MGADIGDQTKEIEEIRSLSGGARDHLSHHLRNELQTITLAIEHLKRAAEHIIKDIERLGL